MVQSKTRELLNSMSVTDKKAFRNYLDSPFFNCGESEKRLYKVLESGMNKPELKREVLFSALFPGKSYDDKYFRYIISALNKHLINFFTIRQVERDSLLSGTISAKALSNRDCEKAYTLLHQEITKQKEKVRGI